MSEKTFHEYFNANLETLDLYTMAITRAHGESHPEAFQVRELFESIQDKLAKAGADRPELNMEFLKLREITNNYEVPADVCETYAAVYHMLEKADDTYKSE